MKSVNRIILALDTTNLDEAINITKKVKDKIYTIKLGLEFWNAHGKVGVKKFNQININNIFLDLKLADTANTIKKSILALDGINFEYLTVHSFAGNESIKKAKEAAKKAIKWKMSKALYNRLNNNFTKNKISATN